MPIDMSNLSLEEAKQVHSLREDGWTVKYNVWTNPKYQYHGLLYFFTFEEAVEKINQEAGYENAR